MTIYASNDAVAHESDPLDDGFGALVLTGPETLGGRLLRRYWHPIAYAHELLLGRALPVMLMNERFTLYRGESGKPYLVGFNCPHRKTQLSVGWVEGEAIRCFYHGWMFNGFGQCIDQPAEPEPFCEKVTVPRFHAEEYLGLIFAYIGPGDPPPLPRFPELEFPDRIEPTEESFYRKCNWFQGVENGVDQTHGWYVHIRGENDGRIKQPPLLQAVENDWGVATGRNGLLTGGVGFPNLHPLTKRIDEPGLDLPSLPSMVWEVPIDDLTHRQIGVQLLPWPLNDPRIKDYHQRRETRFAAHEFQPMAMSDAVLAGEANREGLDYYTRTHAFTFEDDLAQVGQGRIEDRRGERLGRTDAGVILVRKVWQRELRAFSSGAPRKQWRWVPPETWGDSASS